MIDVEARIFAAKRASSARLLDVSVEGARIRAEGPLEIGSELAIDIEGVGRVPAVVAREAGRHEYGVRLQVGTGRGSLREKMIQRIYCTKLCVGERDWRSGPCFAAIFRRLGKTLLAGFDRVRTAGDAVTPAAVAEDLRAAE